MNFVFAIATTLVPLLLAVAGSYLLMAWILNRVEADDVESWKALSEKVHMGLAFLLIVLVPFTSIQSFGPRNTLDVNSSTYYPEVNEVESGKEFTEKSEWRNKFDDELTETPIEPKE